MSFEKYDIFFRGQVINGQDPTKVRQRIGQRFGVDDAQLDRLFSGKPVAVKKNVDMDSAIEYRVRFRDDGALVDIKPSRNESASRSISPTPETRMTLAPAGSGSLEDLAPNVTPAPTPDISGIQLAPAGSPLPAPKEPDPAKIETDHLRLQPANSGDLLDCHRPLAAMPLPDIGGLRLMDTDPD